MPLHEIVKTILTEYSKAKNEPLAGHPLGSLIRHDAAAAVKAALGELAHAFECLLTEERERTTRLSRTRQKVSRVGVLKTLKDWALSDKETDGFTMLLDRGMPELTGEAIVLRHPKSFEPEVLAAARQRLVEAGIDLRTLPNGLSSPSD
jgi:hypothetical protein